MALGVLDALKAANRTAVVIGINGILPAVKQIEAGGMLATVDFNMFKIGCTATRAAVRHLKKEPLPEKVMLPAEVIDKTNYKAWLVPVDQRTCPEWTKWRAEVNPNEIGSRHRAIGRISIVRPVGPAAIQRGRLRTNPAGCAR